MERRRRILEAAARVFAETGYRGATTRRIAEAAGVNEVTLFRHFGSKDELINEAVGCMGGGPPPRLPEAPGDVPAELERFARRQLAHLAHLRLFIRTCMGESAERPEIMARVKEGPVGARRDVRRYLELLCARGLTRPDVNVDAAAAMLLGALFSDAMSRDLMPEMYTYEEEAAPRLYVGLLLHALGYSAEGATPSTRSDNGREERQA